MPRARIGAANEALYTAHVCHALPHYLSHIYNVYASGAVPTLRRRVVRGDEQLLEGGDPRHPEPAVPAGGARPVPDAVLPPQAATARAAWPRRRRLSQRLRRRRRRRSPGRQ